MTLQAGLNGHEGSGKVQAIVKLSFRPFFVIIVWSKWPQKAKTGRFLYSVKVTYTGFSTLKDTKLQI